MIADAVDTLFTLGWALLAWIVLTAAFAVAGLYAVAVTVWATVRGVLALWRGHAGPSWRRRRLSARIYVQRRARRSGGLLWLRALRVQGPPLVDGDLSPDRGAADLLGLREVSDPVDEVVDALPVDAETCRDLVRREVAGDVHLPKIAPLSSPSTARIRVVQLLNGECMAPRQRLLTHWTDHQRWLLAAETGFACAYCQVVFGSVARRPGREPVIVRMEVDHVVPFAWTGHENDKENCVAACQICNGLKQDTMFDSIVNARRTLDRLWVKAGYQIEFIPTRSHFEDPDGWAREYARHMRVIGVRQDAD